MNITAEDTAYMYDTLPDDFYNLNINQRDSLARNALLLMERGVSVDRATAEIAEAVRLYCIMAARLRMWL